MDHLRVMVSSGSIIVAIPVKDEQARIGACLAALASQTRPFDHLVLLLNNCTDRTAEICLMAQRATPSLKIIACTLPVGLASAGEARRLALAHAMALAEHAIILTTDADALPDPDWIALNVSEFQNGADVVCGMAALDANDARAIRAGLHFDNMREAFLLHMLDEITAMADPDPADPWPRHQQNSGASIAMRAATLRLAGGAPCVAVGEDRALINRLCEVDARIRHAPGITVRVSGRLEGRAEGGMADTIKRRITRQDAMTDAGVEPAIDAFRRALACARLRAVRAGQASATALADDLGIPRPDFDLALRATYFGAAWAQLQRLSPVLQRRRVAFAYLARETRQALYLRDQLRGSAFPVHGSVRHAMETGHAG
jgi:GT2 family glycosyltransferase